MLQNATAPAVDSSSPDHLAPNPFEYHTRQNLVKPPIDSDFDAYIRNRIDFRVRQLTLGFNLSEDDQDDYRAAMVSEVYLAMQRFDPQKAKCETFASRVLDRYVLYATRSRCNQMKRPCLNPIGFADIDYTYEPISNDPSKGERNEVKRIDLRLDIESAIEGMSKRLQQATRLLMQMSPADAARKMGIHPCSIYRLMKQIGEHLTAIGLSERKKPTATADVEGAQKGVR